MGSSSFAGNLSATSLPPAAGGGVPLAALDGFEQLLLVSVNPNTRLGSYEILSLIGAGGMGEVYRARDMRLEREVAVKARGLSPRLSLRGAKTGPPERDDIELFQDLTCVRAVGRPRDLRSRPVRSGTPPRCPS